MTTLKVVRPDDTLSRALAELDAELRRCEYRAGLPPWLRTEAARIDSEVCGGTSCGRCGRRGLTYYPGYRTAGARPQYRAWAVCPGCGDWSEI
jgi:hypothetical protein